MDGQPKIHGEFVTQGSGNFQEDEISVDCASCFNEGPQRADHQVFMSQVYMVPWTKALEGALLEVGTKPDLF